MICTGLVVGAPAVLSKTGTVTSELLIVTSFGDTPAIGLSAPATNSNGEVGGGPPVTVRVSPPPPFVAWVRQFTASVASRLRFGYAVKSTVTFALSLHAMAVCTQPAMLSSYGVLNGVVQLGNVAGAGNEA